VELQERTQGQWVLTSKGQHLNGQIPGAILAEKLMQGLVQVEPLQAELGSDFSLNYGALRKENAVDMVMQDDTRIITILDPTILQTLQQRQRQFSKIFSDAIATDPTDPTDTTGATATTNADWQWFEEQGWVERQSGQDYQVAIAPTLQTLSVPPLVTTLTSDLLISGKWQEVELKPYNIQDHVPDVAYGRPTILSQCIQRLREIFLGMGFNEMSGYLVESAFWNFDALFTPQDHPAREVQDTFYLANPRTVPLPSDLNLREQVKQVHEQNYGGTWTEAEASKAILRAHTTTSTARKLHQLQGQSGKYFSIDKVFRNETVDRTHLAEFHQIEGVVIGELLSVRTLMGYLNYFYQQLGFQKLKFKPTYNPYTEPSLEIYAYHPPSHKYLEVGNSGLFRPEMLAPLNCDRKSTIAWGLGLERIAMILYDVEELSDLVGSEIKFL
jgi:phenylalanyl-tRNA synthetase alpha chain